MIQNLPPIWQRSQNVPPIFTAITECPTYFYSDHRIQSQDVPPILTPMSHLFDSDHRMSHLCSQRSQNVPPIFTAMSHLFWHRCHIYFRQRSQNILPIFERSQEVPSILDSDHTMSHLFLIAITGCPAYFWKRSENVPPIFSNSHRMSHLFWQGCPTYSWAMTHLFLSAITKFPKLYSISYLFQLKQT